jgi:hypothetical protein
VERKNKNNPVEQTGNYSSGKAASERSMQPAQGGVSKRSRGACPAFFLINKKCQTGNNCRKNHEKIRKLLPIQFDIFWGLVTGILMPRY